MAENHDPNFVLGAPQSSEDAGEASSSQGTELTREQFLKSYTAGTIDDDHGLGEEAEAGYRPESSSDRA